MRHDKENAVYIPIGSKKELEGDLQIPEGAKGVVIFARGKCPDWVTPLFQSSVG